MKSLILLAFFLAIIVTGCGKSDNQTSGNDKNNMQPDKNSDQQTLQVSSGDKSIEIHTSGMTCTGCEKTIKTKVKKVEGVKDVIADFNTNVVKASFDPGKTNQEAISEAIKSAGYEVLSVKQF
ncbi:MAG: heavy-metal-associated domain-containing protein [Ignavibacteria bacterium]